MSTYERPDNPPEHRRVKVTHLVFGLLFLGLAGVWALVESDVITSDRLPVLAPAVLIGAGLIGLVASLANGRRHETDDTVPTEEIR